MTNEIRNVLNEEENKRNIIIKIMNTNARSLLPKIESLNIRLLETDTDIAIITETWISDETSPEEMVMKMRYDKGFTVVHRNRTGKRGGGVAIITKNSTVKALRVVEEIQKYEIEILCATAKIKGRKVIIIAIYVPPRYHPRTKANRVLGECVMKMRSKIGVHPVLIAGDMNCADIDFSMTTPYITLEIAPETRMGNKLDRIYASSSFEKHFHRTWPPLHTEDNINSDHKVLMASFYLNCEGRNTDSDSDIKLKFHRSALEKIKSEIAETEWDQVTGDAEDFLNAINEVVHGSSSRHAMTEKRKKKINDKPWMTRKLKKIIIKKNNEYRLNGYSCKFKELRKLVNFETSKRRKEFYENKVTQLEENDTKRFYGIVKALSDIDNIDVFDPIEATGSENASEAVRKMEEHFASLSDGFGQFHRQEYDSMIPFNPITVEEVLQAMKRVKIPKGSVIGDLPGEVIKHARDVLAVPITILVNRMYQYEQWPKSMKIETGSPIPKLPNPSSIKEIRLVSMTTYINKVAEHCVFGRMSERFERERNIRQFGAKKKTSCLHVLAELVQYLVEEMAEGGVAAAIFYDFSAAFNSGRRSDMINEFRRLNIPEKEVRMMEQFLCERQLKIKSGGVVSKGVAIHGGSPQGSYLGSICFIQNCNRFDMHKTSDSICLGYMDDITNANRVDKNRVVMQDNGGEVKEVYWSDKLQSDYNAIKRFADEKLFRLNTKKTVSMVFGNTDTENPALHIEDGSGGEIGSVTSFKLLGLTLDRKMSMKGHVRQIVRKCSRRIWVLRNLRRNGISEERCLMVYKAQVRSIIDYGGPVYWPLINESDCSELDRVQSSALKTIYGFDYSYNEVLQKANVKKISERLKKLTEEFVWKEYKNGNQRMWFQPREEISMQLRNRREVEEDQSRQVRMFKGPISTYKRILNDLLRNELQAQLESG